MGVIAKRPLFLLAAALTCLSLVFFLFQSRDALFGSQIQKPVFGSSDALVAADAQLGLVADAHMLPSADSFHRHFQAVTRLNGITVKEAKQTCTWPSEEPVDFQYDKDSDWVVHDRPDEEIASRRKEWHAYIAGDAGTGTGHGMIPYDKVKDRFQGRGLVIVAGNQDTLMRVKVILRQLVYLKSKIAIEIHYWDDEMTDESMKELSDMYQPISFNDLSKEHNIIHIKKDGLYINYQLKTASLINSKFAEPLLLDSDNVPVIDPATLYDSAVYKEHHTVFWPDIARSWPQNPAWAITNTPCRMDEYEQESGQLMVDKRRFWYHLQLASWLNNEQGAYYNQFLLGDKDMFRFAWHALKTDYGRPLKWLTSVGTENEGYYCGHSFAQHHPDDGRVAFLHGGAFKTVALEIMRWNRDEKGGYFRHYKRAPTDEDPAVNVNVAIIWDGAAYYHKNKTDKFRSAMCTDMSDVSVRDTNEILPGWEKHFGEIGGYWQLDQADAKNKAGEINAATIRSVA
ncbi:family 71 glycosyltransferase [Bombardia bombarda]|uniref:Family 71 glycosyltransferase n=1 Tax=Bombardia bombarda TaxID=252184 RepID=A0AA40C8G7_9PEZI|nr:family 71 glycosyltransferase [Bombardia bombarda]